MGVVLLPDAADPDDPMLIRWRVGPGMVRVSGTVSDDDMPPALRPLLAEGLLESVSIAPGHIDTRLAPGQSAAGAGQRVRSALRDVLDAPGGWPADAADDHNTDPDLRVSRAADREIADAVRAVIDGPFGEYTASHGGSVELVDVVDGVVRVRLHGHCHGCAAADLTLQANLAHQLRKVPGFVSISAVGDSDSCTDRPDPRPTRTWLRTPRLPRHH